MSGEEDSSLDIEIEALKAIYIHELEVSCDGSKRPTCVKVSLHPATADNAEEQYVRLDLVLDIPTEYPDVLPEITIRNPRGLSDEKIIKIQQELEDTAQENVGGPMLYQLIEVAKEHLTQENIPCCQCTICLYGFAEGDVFTKTQCYHYFHSHCLARYLRHALEQIAQEEADKPSLTPSTAAAVGGNEDLAVTKVVCPVCRLPLSPLLGLAEQEHPPPVEQQRQPDFHMTPELEKLQRSMAQLYVRQQRQGGIINVDAEKNKFLLEISVAPESNNVPETPKRFGAFKLRGWGPPLRPTSTIAPAQTSDAPLHGLSDRQLEPQFPRPSKNRHSRPVHRQQRGSNESYDKHHISNGYFEHSGGSSSSSGAERLQRSDTDQKPRRPRPHHHGRGRGSAQQQQQNWHRPPRDRREGECNAHTSDDYQQDYSGSYQSNTYEERNSSREASRTGARTLGDSSPTWDAHRDQDYQGDRYQDAPPPRSPTDGEASRYYNPPEAQSRHRGGGQGYRRGRRGTSGDKSHHTSAAQAFRKKQLKSQGVAARNHEPPGICTTVENR